jgi:leader peptidase (prepilin peptidase)/N-methyltransferase
MMARRSTRLPNLLQRHGLAAAVMASGIVLSLYLLPLPQGAFAALLAALAIFIAVIDLEYRIIPDAANALMFAAGLLLVVLEAFPGQLLWGMVLWDLGDALLRSAVAGGVLLALRYFYGWRRGVEGLGLGDAKLAAAGAPFLAWPVLPVALLIAAFGGLVAVGAQALAKGKRPSRRDSLPFGAFLAPAIWIAYLIAQTGFAY